VLVSNNVAGSLIGKAGSAINDIQAETGARIKLSQANEFFPATQFRVVLITGTPEAVKHANSIVWEKISNVRPSLFFVGIFPRPRRRIAADLAPVCVSRAC
jgi:RNA-binding protein Nova